MKGIERDGKMVKLDLLFVHFFIHGACERVPPSKTTRAQQLRLLGIDPSNFLVKPTEEIPGIPKVARRVEP